jgi:hypothetical protein
VKDQKRPLEKSDPFLIEKKSQSALKNQQPRLFAIQAQPAIDHYATLDRALSFNQLQHMNTSTLSQQAFQNNLSLTLPRGSVKKLISEIPCNNSHCDYKYFASVFQKENGRTMMRDLSTTLMTVDHRESELIPEE